MKLSAKLVLSFCSIILFMLLLFAVYMRNSQKITACPSRKSVIIIVTNKFIYLFTHFVSF